MDGRRLVAIMFTDLVGFTALTQENESKSIELLERHRAALRKGFQRARGHEIKTTGDGFLVEFENALDATQCAVDIQRELKVTNVGLPELERIRVRIGIHLGDVVHSNGDVLGDTVNIAARIEPLADPGGVCVSAQVFDQVSNKVGFLFEKLDEIELKNVRQTIGVYRLHWDDAEPTGPEPSDTAPLRLAVLPMANMSPDANDEYFSDGLTDELISTLSKVPGLSVISRTSVMLYKERPKPLGEIGRELKVGTVLEGSVRKSGNRVRISVKLLDAPGDRHLWGESYDRELEDIFAVQGEIAERVAAALKIRLLDETRARVGKAMTRDARAYTLYLQGRAHRHRATEESYMAALGYYEQAVRRDPMYALAYAAMADAYHFLGFFEFLPATEAFAKGVECARVAVGLDATLPQAHLALAETSFDTRDEATAETHLRRALELDPSAPEAHLLAARHLLFRRQFEEALAETERALDLDPLSLFTRTRAATWLLYGGHPERSAVLFQQILGDDPASLYAWNNLGLSHVRLGMYDQGVQEIQKAIEMSPTFDPAYHSDLTYALVRAGRIGEARQSLEHLLQNHKVHGTGATSVAMAYGSLGDRAQALEWLERALQEGSGTIAGALTEFAFEEMKEDPGFQTFAAKLHTKPVDR